MTGIQDYSKFRFPSFSWSSSIHMIFLAKVTYLLCSDHIHDFLLCLLWFSYLRWPAYISVHHIDNCYHLNNINSLSHKWGMSFHLFESYFFKQYIIVSRLKEILSSFVNLLLSIYSFLITQNRTLSLIHLPCASY